MHRVPEVALIGASDRPPFPALLSRSQPSYPGNTPAMHPTLPQAGAYLSTFWISPKNNCFSIQNPSMALIVSAQMRNQDAVNFVHSQQDSRWGLRQ